MTAADIFLATEHIGKYWEHGSYSTELGMMKDVCPDDSSLTVTNCFLQSAKVPADAETGGEYCKCWIETDRVGRITALAHDAPSKPELRTDDTNPVTAPNAVMAEPEVIGGYVGSSTPQVDETPLEPPTPPQPTSAEEKALPETIPEPTPEPVWGAPNTAALPEVNDYTDACDKILSGGDPFGADAEDKKYALQEPETVECIICGQAIEDIANNTREIEEKCQEIWAGPDTLDKIADFVQERHYGDRVPIKMILLASMQHRITTLSELSYISINAESGGGKSDLVRSVTEILPADAVKFGTVSAKFLPRMGAAWDGKIIILDDQQPDADNIEYMKICCANGTIRPTYGTLLPGAKGEPAYKPEELPLPMRLCYIIARVDTAWGADAEQVQNRIITVYLDDSEEQRQRVLKKMTERMQVGYVDYHQKTAEIMREKLWMGLPDRIYVDFRDIIGHIDAKNIENRMYGHLLNMIASNAVYRRWTGSEAKWDEVNGSWLHDDATTHEPIIYASKDDAIPVIDMFNSFLTIPADGSGDANAGGNVYKFFGAEKGVHDAILKRYSEQPTEWKSVNEMSTDLGIPNSTLNYALKGRTSSRKVGATEGLLTKMPGLDRVVVSKSEDNTLRTPDDIKEWERNHSQNIVETGTGDGRTSRRYDTITWDPYAYWQDRNTRQAVIKWID